MTFKQFLCDDSGKAITGLFLTAILIVYPPAASWFAASLTLSYTVTKLKNAFKRLEEQEQEAATNRGSDDPAIQTDNCVAISHDSSLAIRL